MLFQSQEIEAQDLEPAVIIFPACPNMISRNGPAKKGDEPVNQTLSHETCKIGQESPFRFRVHG